MNSASFVGRIAALLLTSIAVYAGPLAIPPAAANCGAGATIGSLSGKSCQVGDFHYFNFGLLVSASTPSGSLIAGPNDVEVVLPMVAGESVQFLSDKFNVLGGDKITYYLSYTLDPPPPILPGFELDLFTETPVQPGTATINASVCAGGIFFFGPGCTNIGAPNFQATPYSLQVFHKGLPLDPGDVKLNDTVSFSMPVNLIDVRIEMILDASKGGSAQIRGVGTAVTPEPGTYAMMGAGMLGLLFLRRRK